MEKAPAPIPTVLWGGPDKVWAFEDAGMKFHAANFRIAGRGGVVFSVANGEGCWVIDGPDFLDFARAVVDYHDSLAGVDSASQEESSEENRDRPSDS